jgi:large subunit ribosomal protein L15
MATKLPKTVEERGKRLGRGYGSGKGGHTVGRGQKGQKARGKIGNLFEGIKVKKSLLKKLPLGRGKGRFAPGKKPIIIKLGLLNLLPAKSSVDLALLIKEGIVKKDDAQRLGVKILGDGELTKKLTISVPISKRAAKTVEKAGGQVKI